MERQKRVLAIHDISCVGRCSLTVALPILSAAGLDTGVLPTAVLSTHTGGFTGFTYRDLTEDIAPISQHWQSLGLRFDALYSGYLGSFDQIALVGQLFDDFRTQNNLILVDPVMGDNGQLYPLYSPQMAQGMAQLCGKADIIVPNLTEAAFMLDQPYLGEVYTQAQIEQLLRDLSHLGARQVVLTGVSLKAGQLGAAAYDARTGAITYAFCEKIEGYFHGTGDVFGSALLAALMNGFALDSATQVAVTYTRRCIELTQQLAQEARYGVCFERALGELIDMLGLRA